MPVQTEYSLGNQRVKQNFNTEFWRELVCPVMSEIILVWAASYQKVFGLGTSFKWLLSNFMWHISDCNRGFIFSKKLVVVVPVFCSWQCGPVIVLSSERNCSVVGLLIKEKWSSFRREHVDSILFLYNIQWKRLKGCSIRLNIKYSEMIISLHELQKTHRIYFLWYFRSCFLAETVLR